MDAVYTKWFAHERQWPRVLQVVVINLDREWQVFCEFRHLLFYLYHWSQAHFESHAIVSSMQTMYLVNHHHQLHVQLVFCTSFNSGKKKKKISRSTKSDKLVLLLVKKLGVFSGAVVFCIIVCIFVQGC